MELGLLDLFTSYEMELETHVHVKVENQLAFHELQLHAITRVEKLWDETNLNVQIENQLGFCELKLHAINIVEKLWDGTRDLWPF